jgi:hypothetical protein
MQPRTCRAADYEPGPAKKARVTSVLQADVYYTYHPKSRETRDAHQLLLQHVQAHLGDIPPEYLYDAVQGVLEILKNEEMPVRHS